MSIYKPGVTIVSSDNSGGRGLLCVEQNVVALVGSNLALDLDVFSSQIFSTLL